MSRLFIASADGHVGLRSEDYRPYLESSLHTEFDEFLRRHRYRWTVDHDDAVMSTRLFDWMRDNDRFTSGGLDALWDPQRRLKEMDDDGIVVDVLFPDDQNHNTPPWLVGLAPAGMDHTYPPPLRLAGARAYNRWLAEYCSHAPDRLIGTTVVGSLHDVDAAVAEMHRAHASGLRHGVMLPLDYYLPLYHHPRYEPFWQACEDLDLTVAVHLADGGPDWYGDDGWDGAIYVLEAPFLAHRPLWSMIFGRVFERHPKLRVAFTEVQATWVIEKVPSMDYLATSFMRASEVDPLKKKPSEYFHEHCFIANSTMRRRDIELREAIGVDVLVWGADAPHHEGSWPTNHDHLREIFAGVPLAEVEAIVGGNFLRAYHVNEPELRKLAGQIGPQPADLGLVAS